MSKATVISHEKLVKMFEDEEKGLYDMHWIKEVDFDGLLYTIYQDAKTGDCYAVNIPRCVHMGFNENEPGKEAEFEEIMKREGRCAASWGVTGRTLHQMLAEQLALKYPQYRFEIGYNYKCVAYDDHRMVLMPGFEPVIQI